MDDRRESTDATEVADVIAKREARERNTWLATLAGIVGSVSGIGFAFVALLMFQNTDAAIIGFILFGISAGIVTPGQITKLVSEVSSKLLGR